VKSLLSAAGGYFFTRQGSAQAPCKMAMVEITPILPAPVWTEVLYKAVMCSGLHGLWGLSLVCKQFATLLQDEVLYLRACKSCGIDAVHWSCRTWRETFEVVSERPGK
jgi:hypothetical protein